MAEASSRTTKLSSGDGLQKVVNSQWRTINYLLKQVGYTEEEAKMQMEVTTHPQPASDSKQLLNKHQKVSAPTTQPQENIKSGAQA